MKMHVKILICVFGVKTFINVIPKKEDEGGMYNPECLLLWLTIEIVILFFK